MPPDSGAAFVLILHLGPGHVSMLPDLLKKYTNLTVVQAENGMKLLRNRVHVIPPNTEMTVMDETLFVRKPREPRGLRHPIDAFFRSLAEERKERAIGIILSGNGADGTLGLKSIKAELGMAMVQDPSSAKYDGMPKSAIGTGMVDYILTPDKMGPQVVAYIRHPVSRRPLDSASSVERQPESLQRIFRLLQSRTGHDFSSYKKNTLCRRIGRRMSVHQIEKLPDYVNYLERNPQEVRALFKELLIGVTGFFRDAQAFDALRDWLLSDVLAGKPNDYQVRVWVPGCSSGEEVYSIAIVLRECMDTLKKNFKAQIFGTDIDGDTVSVARLGFYPSSIAADVGPQRLRRFFIAEESGYRIKKEIREMAIFAVQDVLRDPPFTRLDLLSCRNLLIYLDSELQKKLLPLFHYALKPGGILFLGSAETINGFTDLFFTIDRKWKLFERRVTAASTDAGIPFPAERPRFDESALPPGGQAQSAPAAISAAAQQLLLDSYAPPCALIDSEGQVLYAHDRAGRYLGWSRSDGDLDILQTARVEIKDELAAAMQKARLQKRQVSTGILRVRTNGGWQRVTLTVKPVRRVGGLGDLLMVVFEEAGPARPPPRKERVASGTKTAQLTAQLERELKSSRERLQTTIEQLEAANEEQRSYNEELQSANEELQSTNEELQSLNEELVTVNAELQGKIAHLSRTNDDMKNLLDSTKIATLFLDNQLCIKRFTPEATKIINLIQGDVGRPIADLVSNLEEDTLVREAREVIDSLNSKERPVRTRDGHWYLSRIVPYRTLDNVIDGVVVTFTDISEQKLAEAALVTARSLAEGIVETVRDPMLALDGDFTVIAGSAAFYSLFGESRETTVGRAFFEAGNGRWDIPELRELLEKILPQNARVDHFIVEHDFPKIGRRKMAINALCIHREGLAMQTILLTFKDLT